MNKRTVQQRAKAVIAATIEEELGMRKLIILSVTFVLSVSGSVATAGVIFGSDGSLGGGFRWDAAPRTQGGRERSLDGGLRYSVQGGSMQAYRDLFTWDSLPTVGEFTTAVDQAFGAWSSIDPLTGLSTALTFVNDTANTSVVGGGTFGSFDFRGAEIDLFGANAGDSFNRGYARFSATFADVTLTSGTANYGGSDGGGAITGADVYINSNAGASYSLDGFRRLLTHELGHAIGLGDVEDFDSNGFIDDNYDGTSASSAESTLNNSWAGLVDPFDPSASVGLTQFTAGIVDNGSPGLDSPGVNILMESEGLGIAAGNPVTSLVPLTNDDYGTRQFLYPSLSAAVPEPGSIFLLSIGMMLIGWRHRAACGFSSLLHGREKQGDDCDDDQ